MGSQSTSSVSERPVSHHRAIDSIHSSSAPSPLTVQTPAEVEEPMLCGDPGLRCTRDLRSRLKKRASLVEGQPGFLEWQDDLDPSSEHVDRDRCISPRVGCSEGQSVHKWLVVRPRESSPHQCTGAESGGFCSQDLCFVREEHTCSPTNGQQDSSILYQQDGRNQILRPGSTSLPTVAMVSPERDYNFSGVPPRCGQLCSGPGVTPPPVISRVETEQTSPSSCNQDNGELQHRSVCNTSEQSTQAVRQLETGPIHHSHRRNDTQLEGQRSVCLSTILPDREMSTEGGGGEGDTDTHSTYVEYAALVPSSPGPADSTPSLAASKARLPDRPIQSVLPKERSAAIAAWKISRDNTQALGYQRELPALSKQAGAKAPIQLTSQLGQDGSAGVTRGKLIPFIAEYNHSWTS